MEYTEAHRVLVTYIRGVKTVPADVLERKFTKLIRHFNENTDAETTDAETTDAENAKSLRDYISAINVRLEKLGFKVAAVRDANDSLHYVFVNTRFDDIIQGCTPYTAGEIDAVKQLVDNIVDAHNFAFCMPHVNAKQLVGSVLRLKASDADFFLRRLVDDGWFDVVGGKVVLAPASLAELHDYLLDRFGVYSADDSSGKLLRCAVCRELVTAGTRLAAARFAFHNKCLALYQRNRDVGPPDLTSEDLENTVSVGPSR